MHPLTFVILGAFTSSGVVAWRRGDICNNSVMSNDGCREERKDGCYGACAGNPLSELAGCRSLCNYECDKCTLAQSGSKFASAYDACMAAAKTCSDRQDCATKYNSASDECKNLVDSSGADAVSFNRDDCGSSKVLEVCCAAGDIVSSTPIMRAPLKIKFVTKDMFH